MCGIIGYVGKNKKAQEVIMEGLHRLEYRGYDSAGMAYYTKDNKLNIIKKQGEVKNLKEILPIEESNLGIGHTRWATHGEPSEINCHPHRQGQITIVHNGSIELDYLEKLKNELTNEGYKFESLTDTEILAAFLDKLYKETNDIHQTLIQFNNHVKGHGSYALGIIVDNNYDKLYAIKNESPLIIGSNNDENYIASDIPAISKYTNKYIVLEDEEFVELTADKIKCFDKDGFEIEKNIKIHNPELDDNDKGIYNTFMEKEIHQQPNVFKKMINSYMGLDIDSSKKQENLLNSEKQFDYLSNKLFSDKIGDYSKFNKISIVACGSAYYAGLIGKKLIEKYVKIPVEVEPASEFKYADQLFIDDKSLVIAISQSGETADTKSAIERAKTFGCKTLGILNRQDSSIGRMVDHVLYTTAGSENSVATTKAYSAQLTMLSLFALNIVNNNKTMPANEKIEILNAIKRIPEQIQSLLNDDAMKKYEEIAENIYNKESLFYIGRGIDHAIGLEGALKSKEIACITSQATLAGELKHGPLALIKEKTPVIATITDENIAQKTLGNVKEAYSRGAEIYLNVTENLCDKIGEISNYNIIKIPNTHPLFQSNLTIIPLQNIALNLAKKRGKNIDKPKNLAKSVTVE